MHEPEGESWDRWPLRLSGLAALVALFLLIRLPILTGDGLLLGWNSDAAIFGLMARGIAAGRELPVYYWGQSYMGPLTSYLAVPIGLALGHIGPLAVRLAVSLQVVAGSIFFWLALRTAFDARVASLIALWLAIGPEFLFQFVISPSGAEHVLFLGGLIAWLTMRGLARGGLTPGQWLFFGLLSGAGWWINQGVVFVMAAALVVIVVRSRFWALAWPEPRIRERLTLALAERTSARSGDLRLVLRLIAALLFLDLLLGMLRQFSPKVPAFFLDRPVLEPLIALTAFYLLVELLFGRDLRHALRRPGTWLPPALLFALGAVIGYAPVLVGERLRLFPDAYGLSTPLLPLSGVPAHVAFLFGSDLWQLLGADRSPLGIALGAILAAALVAALLRYRRDLTDFVTLRPKAWGPRAVCGVTILLSLLFYLGSSRAHHGAMRYIVLALPMLYAFAAAELLRLTALSRVATGAALVTITLALLVPRLAQARAVAEARSERCASFPGDFDPRPVIRKLAAEGYTVCYTNYWIAYKLQFLTDERTRFIPYRSFDRNRPQSRMLAAMPVRKCWVALDGTITPWQGSPPAP
ncbi:MAG: hypothetical protein JWN02_1061 [Acidobacteria bacterium]|nr:hypothetical protein [Acidobacteriota bacterium]